MDRYLAIDYGEKRLGIAISDPLNLTAQVYPHIKNEVGYIDAIKKLIQEKEVTAIVLGYPKTLKGEEGEKAKYVKAFSKKLVQETGLKIILQDERFSTLAATKHLIAADVSWKKRKQVVDSQAAAFFLQGFLDGI